MKVAVVGSRSLTSVELEQYIPSYCSEIVSGGAIGVDFCAAEYAHTNHLTLTEFFPEYQKYKRGAPIVRNKQIVDYADEVIVFWDGISKGSYSVIQYCNKVGKKCTVIRL